MIKEKEIGRGARARERERYEAVLGYLPRGLASEIREIERSVHDIEVGISEVRVRADGLSSLILYGIGYPLFYRVTREEVAEILDKLSDGAAYAHRDTVRRGYVTASGIRVGVSGLARYEGESICIGEVGSLVFRLGSAVCDYAEELYSEWQRLGMPNLLVAAPPMGGKTTALRALASHIGSGRRPQSVVVVDERCEFDRRDYRNATVDILRGYRRAGGIELAYRTMSAEVIIADEIADEADAKALIMAHGAGVRLISSVHAASFSDILRRECLMPLIERGVFERAAVIFREGNRYRYEMCEVLT